MALSIPTEPSVITPERPPPGWRMKLLPFNDRRRIIAPRLQLIHTNAAQRQGSIESSYNHSMINTSPGYIYGTPQGSKYTTIPHGQVDMDGDAAILLELNRQSITNARANPFSLGVETADRGWETDPYPTGSWFTEPQMQKICNFLAYCHMLYKIRLEYPATWDGNGSACHTEPFSYPYWTVFEGKTCPGLRKKDQMKRIILPHSRLIVSKWTGVTPPPPPTIPPAPNPPITGGLPHMMIAKLGTDPNAGWSGWYSHDGGRTRVPVTGGMAQAARLVDVGAVDARTNQRVTNRDWSGVSITSSVTTLDAWLTPYL